MRHALDWIDLSTNQVINRVALPTFPQGMAVGADGSVLITAVGDAAGLNAAGAAAPSGLVYNSYPSRLLATPDGKYIVGVNGNTTTTKVIFRIRSRLRFVNSAHPLRPVRSRRFSCFARIVCENKCGDIIAPVKDSPARPHLTSLIGYKYGEAVQECIR